MPARQSPVACLGIIQIVLLGSSQVCVTGQAPRIAGWKMGSSAMIDNWPLCQPWLPRPVPWSLAAHVLSGTGHPLYVGRSDGCLRGRL
jgi:hypothetical protein